MRKIALLTLIVILGTTAFAAAKTAPAGNPAPVSSAKGPGMVVGVQNSVFGDVPINIPFLGFQINPGMNLEVGLAMDSTSVGGTSTTTFGLLGRLNGLMAEISKVKVGWGAELMFGSMSQPSTTVFALSGLLSAEYMITDSLSVFGHAYLLRFASTSTGGTTRTDVVLLRCDPNVYTGFRVYL